MEEIEKDKTPSWYRGMSNEDRMELLEAYIPEDHLISYDKGGEALVYYPAPWRLYELRLRFPDVRLDTEIYSYNEQSGFVILVSFLYFGESYEKSIDRAKAFKQGNASRLDVLQTLCEARAARQFGISPTLALDMDDNDIARIAIRSEAEHQAKRKAASEKRGTQARNPTSPTDPPTAEQLKKIQKAVQLLKKDMPKVASFGEAENLIKRYYEEYEQSQHKPPESLIEQEPELAEQPEIQAEQKPAPTILDSQSASIRKLCERIGKAEPENIGILTHQEAKELIAQLSWRSMIRVSYSRAA